MGVDDNTILMFTTDNGTESFTWPDGGLTPFYGAKGTGMKVVSGPSNDSLAGHVPAGKVQNGLILRPRLVPDFRGGPAGARTSRRSC